MNQDRTAQAAVVVEVASVWIALEGASAAAAVAAFQATEAGEAEWYRVGKPSEHSRERHPPIRLCK